MALPKDYQWRKGDKVTITATVKHDRYRDGIGDIYLEIEGYHSTVALEPEHATLIQQHLEIGDQVRDKKDGVIGKLVAIHKTYGWLELFSSHDAAPVHCRMFDLERVEPPQIVDEVEEEQQVYPVAMPA